MLQMIIIFLLSIVLVAFTIIKVLGFSKEDWALIIKIAVLFGVSAAIVTVFGTVLVFLF